MTSKLPSHSTGSTTGRTGYAVPPMPRVIHQMWLPNWIQSPASIRHTRAEWCRLNPTWTYLFWDLAAVTALIQSDYPELMAMWHALEGERTIKRADLARLIVLHYRGGIYADMDMMPLQPLRIDGRLSAPMVVVHEEVKAGASPRYTNGFLGSQLGCEHLMEAVRGQAEFLYHPVLDFLGPRALTGYLPANAMRIPTEHVLSTTIVPNALCQNLQVRSWGDPGVHGEWYDS